MTAADSPSAISVFRVNLAPQVTMPEDLRSQAEKPLLRMLELSR
jgi:quinolinate synthase